MRRNGYERIPLGFNRRAVRASASVTREKNTIHALFEVDISEPRRLIQTCFAETGEKISLTAYVVACLSRVVREHPRMNARNTLPYMTGKRTVDTI